MIAAIDTQAFIDQVDVGQIDIETSATFDIDEVTLRTIYREVRDRLRVLASTMQEDKDEYTKVAGAYRVLHKIVQDRGATV